MNVGTAGIGGFTIGEGIGILGDRDEGDIFSVSGVISVMVLAASGLGGMMGGVLFSLP